MRVRDAWLCTGIGLVATVWSLGAAAGVLSYDAQLSIEAVGFQTITTSASGTVEVAADGSFALPAGVLDVDQVVTAPGTPTQFFTKASFVFHNGTGAFRGPAQPGGPMPLLGKLKLFAKAALGYPPVTLTLTRAFGTSTAFASVTNGMTPASFSLYQYPPGNGDWRVGQVVQSYTTTSRAYGTRTNTGFDDRTAMGVGSMNLVIPVYLDRFVGSQFQLSAPVTGLLAITFTPEPTRTSLQVASVAALVLLSRRRLRRRRPRIPAQRA
jgi:hypothetical protein